MEWPVAYWSRRWTDAESRWHSVEHECCCVYEAVKRFSTYLNRKFTIITDYQPITWLRSIRKPKGRLATYCMELQVHDFEIVHRPGRENELADTQSRLARLMPEHRPGSIVDSALAGVSTDPIVKAVRHQVVWAEQPLQLFAYVYALQDVACLHNFYDLLRATRMSSEGPSRSSGTRSGGR